MFIQRLLICTAITVPAAAFALSDNTLQFQGEVTNQTCQVTINGNKTMPIVLLPTTPISKLTAANMTAGRTEFSMEVSGCTVATTALDIKTVFIATTPNAAGRMSNTGDATGVSLQIVDPVNAYRVVNLAGQGETGVQVAVGATSATRKYAVEYVADAVAGAGSVAGSVQYAISYK
ncbi:fimbrial protein [Amantichitinum ursilacus]|uniref:Fimbrial protein n=1 Tax=Amantichitinum ursilacus TaxID=857265 RepID=A0A0N0XL60_9NEIS|nr:fimbrial protein [Amantichitinum ursilacus]KPC53809.1 Fimbrial protein [Amantichitinum ursilacus]